jgi:triacylglycerol lipase
MPTEPVAARSPDVPSDFLPGTPCRTRRSGLWRALLSLARRAATTGGCSREPTSPPPDAETVVLLHGLGRTARSMRPLEARLAEAGFRGVNLDYPSRQETPKELLAYLRGELERCCGEARRPVHFVTHSLGGILVRLLAEDSAALPMEIGRVVMLSPPNQGSEIVDNLGDTAWFEAVMGPTGQALGTDEDSLPNRLGPVTFELGVITGSGSVEPYLSWMIPGENDGKVAVERAKVEGMKDFLVVPASHPFIMADHEVSRQVVRFLRQGRFDHGTEEPGTPPGLP